MVGVIIKVPADHPMIKTDGVGIRMSVDMGHPEIFPREYSKFPFMWAMLIIAVISAGFLLYKRYVKMLQPLKTSLASMQKLTGSLAFGNKHYINSNQQLPYDCESSRSHVLLIACLAFNNLLLKTNLARISEVLARASI